MPTKSLHPSNQITHDALAIAAEKSRRYLETIADRRVAPSGESLAALAQFHERFPEHSTDPTEVIAKLDEIGSPATVASTGKRYFGFVVGGTIPAALAASWLANTWDQNVALRVMSPVAAELEEVVLGWVCEVLGLPADCEGGLVTCATAANFTALAAARYSLLTKSGWNVVDDGMFGAPPIEVVIGEEVHTSVLKALNTSRLRKKARNDSRSRWPRPNARRQIPESQRAHDRLHPGRQRE